MAGERREPSGMPLAVAWLPADEYRDRPALWPDLANSDLMQDEKGGSVAARTIPWPPARNDQCWCGSGRKHKMCCGAPGSGSPR